MFLDGLAAINRTGRQLRGWAEAAGFIHINELKLKVPMGSWPKDPYLKETGMMNLVQMLDGMEAFSLKTFDLLGWSRPETEVPLHLHPCSSSIRTWLLTGSLGVFIERPSRNEGEQVPFIWPIVSFLMSVYHSTAG